MSRVFSKLLLHKHRVSYYRCNRCGYLQTEKPYWLKEAYASPINEEDTGLVSRNITLSKIFTIIVATYFNKSGKYLDYAGGYGLFTRLTRDIGINCYWQDPYCQNLLSVGFEQPRNIKRYEMLTGFEVMEHLENPLAELKKIFKRTDSFLFTTQIIPVAQDIEEWDYLGIEHGQHISLYTIKSLQKIADQLQLNLYTDEVMIHLLTKKKLNNFIFHNLIRFHRCLYPLIARQFKSKTMSDHLRLK
jgi:hypothetical protein